MLAEQRGLQRIRVVEVGLRALLERHVARQRAVVRVVLQVDQVVLPEPAGDRRRVEAVVAGKASATEADVATDPIDAAWIWALIAHARSLRFGERFDLRRCREIVRVAFEEETGGAPMRETPFDWEEEAGVVVG